MPIPANSAPEEKTFKLEIAWDFEKSCEARAGIRVCEWWDSTLVQTTRTNRITAESIIVGVVIKKKSVSVETLSTFL